MTQPRRNPPPRQRVGLHLFALLGGLGLLALLVWNIGLSDMLVHLRTIGWNAPLVLAPYLAIAWCDAKGWVYTIPPTSAARHASLWQVSLARLAGEAVNNLTPTANVGGEIVKAYLLRPYGLETDAGLASVVAAKTALTISQVLLILIGLPFFLQRLGWVQASWWLLVPVAALAYGFSMLLVRWQRQGLMEMVVRGLRRVLPRWQRLNEWQERAQHIDRHLLRFYDGDRRGFLLSVWYHLLGWLLGALEIWFFLYLMGVSASPIDALIIEAMVQPITAAGIIIPGSLGVQEAGGVFLCRLLGFDDGAGLTLMTLKRLREAFYNLIGLAVIVRVTGSFTPWKTPSL